MLKETLIDLSILFGSTFLIPSIPGAILFYVLVKTMSSIKDKVVEPRVE